MKRLALSLLWLIALAGATLAQPTTTRPPLTTMSLTACAVNVPILGTGASLPPACGAVADISGAGTQFGLMYFPTTTTRSSTGAGTNGQILTGQTGAVPLWRSMGGDGSFSSTGAFALTNIPTNTTMTGSVLCTQVGAPGNPGAGTISIYCGTDARLHDRNPAGVTGTTVVAASGTANQFASAISTAGVITYSTANNQSTTGTSTQLLTTTTPNSVYTTGTNAKWIEVFMVGGGGGGVGSGANPGTPGNGGATCWNTSGTACTSPVYQASGGNGGVTNTTNPSPGGAGGGVAGSSTCNDSSVGGGGGAGQGSPNSLGAAGGSSAMGGGAPSSIGSANAVANSGGGGSGGGSNNTAIISGGGGGAGGYCRFVINNPAGSYTYTIGAAGTGGTLGTSGVAGGNGGTGRILVVEHYNF